MSCSSLYTSTQLETTTLISTVTYYSTSYTLLPPNEMPATSLKPTTSERLPWRGDGLNPIARISARASPPSGAGVGARAEWDSAAGSRRKGKRKLTGRRLVVVQGIEAEQVESSRKNEATVSMATLTAPLQPYPIKVSERLRARRCSPLLIQSGAHSFLGSYSVNSKPPPLYSPSRRRPPSLPQLSPTSLLLRSAATLAAEGMARGKLLSSPLKLHPLS